MNEDERPVGTEAPHEPPAPEPEPSQLTAPTAPSEPEGLAPDYDEAGRPSFDYVRDRIEGRYATSLGEEELAGETQQAKTLQEQLDEREKAAKDTLDKLRESMRGDSDDAQ
ncbi:MAG: hypothetical protein H0W01_14350 [Pseudonocardiales bacterium]|nr:hypothetical protein [Pseudonocardiales bacterium]